MNILWICTDQQRFDTLGCTGNEWVHTPNLDRLASEGVLFETLMHKAPYARPAGEASLPAVIPEPAAPGRTGRILMQRNGCFPEFLLITAITAAWQASFTCRPATIIQEG